MQSILITPLKVPFLNTLILLCSGVTVTCAHHALDFSLLEFKKKLYSVCLFLFFSNFAVTASNYTAVIISHLFFSFRLFTFYKKKVFMYLLFTVLLAITFTFLQVLEYYESMFYISDGAYGSTFFMMTGFHGFHVLVGTVFLFVCLCRLFFGHFDDTNYVGLESAIWYWHFVDVVWLFLFIFIYIWGFIPRVGGFVVLDDNFLNFTVSNSSGYSLSFFDFAKDFQINFQDPASKIASDLVNLHHNVVFFLILNLIIVVYLLCCIYFTSSDSNQILINNVKVGGLPFPQNSNNQFLFTSGLVDIANDSITGGTVVYFE